MILYDILKEVLLSIAKKFTDEEDFLRHTGTVGKVDGMS